MTEYPYTAWQKVFVGAYIAALAVGAGVLGALLVNDKKGRSV
jgi:uncharacterized membrane protein